MDIPDRLPQAGAYDNGWPQLTEESALILQGVIYRAQTLADLNIAALPVEEVDEIPDTFTPEDMLGYRYWATCPHHGVVEVTDWNPPDEDTRVICGHCYTYGVYYAFGVEGVEPFYGGNGF